MSWRTIVIASHCKLEYKLGYLVCRGEKNKKIHLSEISSLIVETPAVAITAVLLSELMKHKINLIFCDEKHNPVSQLMPLYGSHDCSRKLKKQILWDEARKNEVWREIVRQKILQQASLMIKLGAEHAEMLLAYADQVESGDSTNREGHSAKVYFNSIFGNGFSRSEHCFENAALNYGYALLLSAFNREVVFNGYDTRIGIFHRNEFNQFNLSCDLMEPFRPVVDGIVCGLSGAAFGTEHKRIMQDVFNLRVKIEGKERSLTDAIAEYVKSVFDALSESDRIEIKNYEL